MISVSCRVVTATSPCCGGATPTDRLDRNILVANAGNEISVLAAQPLTLLSTVLGLWLLWSVVRSGPS